MGCSMGKSVLSPSTGNAARTWQGPGCLPNVTLGSGRAEMSFLTGRTLVLALLYPFPIGGEGTAWGSLAWLSKHAAGAELPIQTAGGLSCMREVGGSCWG